MPDYYNILGISKSASDEEIKNSYRKLAKTHHPDKGGDKNKFQEIQEAYEILSDPNKRSNYDIPQMNFNHTFQSASHNHFFKEHKTNIIKKNDHIYNCNITLKDVYTGIQKKFRVKRNKICNDCKIICNQCNGVGYTVHQIQFGPFTQTIQHTCSNCNGNGMIKKNTECKICENNGFITEENIFDVDIKPGVESGTKISFQEWGEQSTRSNEIPGSFIVNIIVNDHPEFKRKNLNLTWNTTISLRESILGKKIIIPHIIEPIIIHTKGFGIINPNKEYIIYNQGLIDEKGNQGNLYIRFNIEYNECNFNDEQINSLQLTFDKVNFT